MILRWARILKNRLLLLGSVGNRLLAETQSRILELHFSILF
jgi:hypothetical protein